MSRRSLYTLVAVFATALLVGGLVSSWIIVNRVVSGPQFKSRIEEAASQFLQRPLTIDELEWRLWPSRILVGRKVRLWEDPSKRRILVESPMVEVRLTLLSFYRLAVGVAEMKFIRPRCFFRQDESGVWNLTRLLEDLRQFPKGPDRIWGQLLFNRFSIQNGVLAVQDEPLVAIQGSGKLKFGGRFAFELTGHLTESSGTVKLPMGLDANTTLMITGLYVPSSTSTITGLMRSSTTEIELKCAVTVVPRFMVTIDLQNARYHSTSFQHVHAVVRRMAGVYSVDRTEFQGLGGTITAQGSYCPSASTDSLKIAWRTTGIQAQDLFRLAGSTVEVGGILDSDGNIASAPGARFLPSMNGDVKFDLKNGWFGNPTGLLKVLSKLNLTTLITEVTGAHRSRVPFDETQGTVKIVKGIASTVEPFVLENKTLQMAFIGRYDLPNKSVDGKIVVNFLMITDEIIHKIPIVREILLGDKKGLTPIWLSVKGRAADPKIKILSGKSITSPLWNTIANIFRLPERLIQEMTGK